MQTMTSESDSQNTRETKPYPPSFLDRFMRFIQHLPIPYWLTYLILFILQSAIFHGLAWIDGWLPAFSFSPILLLFPLWLWGPMAIMTYLNLTSEAALSGFSPLLDVGEDRLKRLKYEFTTMPNRGVIFSSVFWIIAYVFFMYLTIDVLAREYGFGNIFGTIVIIEGLISYSFGGAIYYHSIRQLWMVNKTVKMVRQFNLFQLDPVYSLARLTSRTGISWIFMLVFTLLLFPLALVKGVVLSVLILQVLLALAAFVLPLQLVNQSLVSEKRRLLSELNQRIESILDKMHQSIDDNQPSELDALNAYLTTLNAERDILKGIPTWPWSSGTLTGFLSAILLPILLFLLQIVIQNWLGE